MISVVLIGRNDSYGYNLHKRAAISLNCLAEVLTHSNDEIIFVDCNTQDDMPTFFEAIHDILTQQAKNLLRILRLRPFLYQKYNKGSRLPILEPLARNIAIRRSNPKNRWILSTNTDMIFVVREGGKSLSDAVAKIPNGFYELPRFEVPQTLWESVYRCDPVGTLKNFRRWGQSLHLNEAIIARDDIRYDGPGDFQLMLRSQLFDISGFDEDMISGWHVDSNIARRLNILNKKTDSLLNKVFGYHCEHTRQPSVIHTYQTTQNDPQRFVFGVRTPYLRRQAKTWGMPDEELEEIKLTDHYVSKFSKSLESALPGQKEPVTKDFFVSDSYDHGQIYDSYHAVPFIADLIKNIPSYTNIGYYGANIKLINSLARFLNGLNYLGHIYVNSDLMVYTLHKSNPKPSRDMTYLHDHCEISENNVILDDSDLFIFDVSMMHFPEVIRNGIAFPEESKRNKSYRDKFEKLFLKCIETEKLNVARGERPRQFLFVGSRSTWFESQVTSFFDVSLTPYCCHVQQGYIKSIKKTDLLVKRKIFDFGQRHKKVILKVPIIGTTARSIYRRLLRSE